MLDERGGFRSDLTIMRLAHDRFRVVTGGAHGMVDRKWFADRMPADGTAQVVDLTSAYTTIGLWGPRARDILGALTGDDISHEGFGFGTCREIEVGSLSVLASRISYVGELGWELYVPIEQGAQAVGPAARGRPAHGAVPVGIGVYATTGRIEKGYRAFGFELDSERTIVEAGMQRPKVKDADFVGREAYLKQREDDPASVLCTLTVDDHTSAVGAEALHARRRADPDRVRRASWSTGTATGPTSPSAGSAPSLGKHLLMAYLPPQVAVVGTELAVNYMEELYPVTVGSADATPLFDPANERIKASHDRRPGLHQAGARPRRRDHC